MAKILLIDGNLLLFRTFYAAYAINKEPGNLPAHLFFKSILDILNQENPQYIFVAFDAHGQTKRHAIFQDYKAGRTSPPPLIYRQKKMILELLELAKIQAWEQLGDEADDLIATLTRRYQEDHEVVIFSEDKDLLQLVNDRVSVVIKNKQDKKTYLKIDQTNFQNHFFLEPQQIIDFKAIAGDPSDNLKGIKGIGNKTAISLIQKYGSLENIYQNLESLTASQQAKFLTDQDNAFLCKKLACLNTEVEINLKLEDLNFYFQNFTDPVFLAKLKELNLNQLHRIFNIY